MDLPAYGPTVLITGPSGSGKSTATASLVERLMAGGYQCCLIDPEWDYHDFGAMVAVGDSAREPSIDIARDGALDPRASRQRMRQELEQRYSLSA